MTSRSAFNTSTKNPTSVKLSGYQTSKAVTKQLEVDSRRMEDRLRELKVAMNREKEERESRGSSSLGIWASGQPGAVTTHANEVLKKKKSLAPPDKTAKPKSGSKGRKIKVLKDSPIEVPQRPKFKLGTSGGDTHRKLKGPACGQCEEKAVALTCMECGENYCTGCYAKFHMKGALKNHRSVPYRSPTSSSESLLPVPYENGYNDPRFNDTSSLASKSSSNGRKSSAGTDSHSPRDKGKVVRVMVKSPAPTNTGNTLLDGNYNEEESASSFAAALAEWRQGKKEKAGGATQAAPATPAAPATQAAPAIPATQAAPGTPRGTTTMTTSEGTSTSNGDISPRQVDIEIKFTENTSLSYADRLLLKKHRRTEVPEAASPNLLGNGAAREQVRKSGELRSGPMVNGDAEFLGDAELEDEHQRYVNIFSKRISPQTTPSDPRPNSTLAISEVTEDDEHLEVASVYSVQEEPGSEPVVIGQPDENTQLSDNKSKAQSTKKPAVRSSERKDPTKTNPPSSASSQKSSTKSPSKSSLKSKDDRKVSSRAGSRASSQSAQSATKPRANQSAGEGARNSLSDSGKDARPKSKAGSSSDPRPRSKVGSRSEARMRPGSKASSASKVGRDEGNTTPTAQQPDRPVSAGLTTRPSDGLKQVSNYRQQSQHNYKEGLGEFFSAGLTGEGNPGSGEQTNKSPSRLSVTPTNQLPDCTFQGSSVWRPDSSLAASDEAQQIPYTPSPPSKTSSRQQSPAKRSARTRSPIKQVERNPETGSPVPEGGDPCKRVSRGGAMGGGDVGMATREREGSSRMGDLPERSCSRIEVDGDDMTGYDEDAKLTHRETSADDKETLEQLTWELASQEGRVTAEGRITSRSILEEDEDQDFGQFSHDAELGILQDDGHGSGLSTPCEVTMSRDEISEEDLQGDFEDNDLCKEEVEALR